MANNLEVRILKDVATRISITAVLHHTGIYFRALVLQLSVHENHLESWLGLELLGSTIRISDSVGLGWGLRICIFNRFPSKADDGDQVLRSTELGEFTCGRESKRERKVSWGVG